MKAVMDSIGPNERVTLREMRWDYESVETIAQLHYKLESDTSEPKERTIDLILTNLRNETYVHEEGAPYRGSSNGVGYYPLESGDKLHRVISIATNRNNRHISDLFDERIKAYKKEIETTK